VISAVDFVFAATMTDALLTLFPREAAGREEKSGSHDRKTKPVQPEKTAAGKKSA